MLGRDCKIDERADLGGADMKKNVIFVVAVLWLFLASITYASGHHVALVIIGSDPEYRTQDYCEYAKKHLQPDGMASYTIEVGDEAQSKYLAYWTGKGFLTAQPLREEDYTAFVKTSGFDKVIYLIFDNYNTVQDPTHYTSSGFAYTQSGITEASSNAYAVLCDKNDVITVLDMKKDSAIIGDGHDSKQILFQKCIRDIAMNWQKIL